MRDKSVFQKQSKSGDQGSGQAVGHDESNSDGVSNYLMEGARAARDKVKEATGKMSHAIGQTLKEEGERLFEKKKGRVVSRISSAGKIVRQVGHALRAVKADGVAKMVDQGADKVEDVSHYLEETTLPKVLEDTAQAVREHQALAVGGLFVVGFALSRFVKASGSRADQNGDEPDENVETENQ